MFLHELLLALSGVDGDIFKRVPIWTSSVDSATPSSADHPASNSCQKDAIAQSRENGQLNSKLCIPADYPFIHPAERACLEGLAELGQHYHHITTRWLTPSSSTTTSTTSTYIRALFVAIDEIPLAQYRSTIVCMERELINRHSDQYCGAKTPLSLLTIAFAKFKLLFPHLMELLCELDLPVSSPSDVNNENYVKGHPTRYAGCKVLDLLYERITQCGVPGVKECLSAIFQSVLEAVFYKQLYAWLMFGRIVDHHQEFFIGHASAESGDGEHVHGMKGVISPVRSDENKWDSSFVLHAERVPSFLGTATASSILFIGKAVSTLSVNLNSTKGSSFMASLTSICDTLPGFEIPASLFSPSFRIFEFQSGIISVRSNIASRLWKVVVVEEEFSSMLSLFKNYYLLGQGDLFTEFILGYESLKLRAAYRLSMVTAHELNVLLKRIQQFQVSETASPSLFYFKERVGGVDVDQPLADHGFPFTLQVRISWPLELIFSAHDLAQYNRIFAWLIRLRQVQLGVERSVVCLKAKGNPFMAWQLRQHVLFFLHCFISFITMDVIQPLHEELLASVQAASALCDFEALAIAHQRSLAQIQTGCLVESECIRRCVDTCERAVRVLVDGDWVDVASGKSFVEQLGVLEKQFKKDLLMLFQSMTGLSRQTPILNQLLLRLDFNRWFSLESIHSSASSFSALANGPSTKGSNNNVKTSIPKALF